MSPAGWAMLWPPMLMVASLLALMVGLLAYESAQRRRVERENADRYAAWVAAGRLDAPPNRVWRR